MATTDNNIVRNWTLVAFNAKHTKLQIGDFTNSESGDKFKSLIFTDANGEHTFVGFSSKLGELTPAQLKAQQHDLQVVKLQSGSYKLCKQGEGNWEDVEL